jgi:V/A-type H+-transporting ATPase subunit C
MKMRLATGLEYVAAVLHGRRSRMAEAERLDALLALRTTADLARALVGDASVASTVDLQKELVRRQADELLWLARRLEGPPADLLDWLAARFHVENLKVLVRGFVSRLPAAEVQAHLVPLPGDQAADVQAMASADSAEALAATVRPATLRQAMLEALRLFHARPRAFFLETALDRAYLEELAARADALGGDDARDVRVVVNQEIDTFNLMLVVRGRFAYGLRAEQVMPFYVSCASLRRRDMAAMLAAPSLAEAAARAVGVAIDALPKDAAQPGAPQGVDPAAVERMAWDRYRRLAARTFRRSPGGLVAAYAALRRVELANLMTVSEGIRAGLAPEEIRRRLISPVEAQAARV